MDLIGSIQSTFQTPLGTRPKRPSFGTRISATIQERVASKEFAELPKEERLTMRLRYRTTLSWWLAECYAKWKRGKVEEADA